MQKKDLVLVGDKLTLRHICESDCTERYVAWLNNPKINQFLETRWKKQTLETVVQFVQGIMQDEFSYLFAIFSDETHIGNIKLGPINPYHKFADISYLIGDKKYWGKGIATEAIKLIVKFGFDELKLNSLRAGSYGENIASICALKKNDFKMAGTYPNSFNMENGNP